MWWDLPSREQLAFIWLSSPKTHRVEMDYKKKMEQNETLRSHLGHATVFFILALIIILAILPDGSDPVYYSSGELLREGAEGLSFAAKAMIGVVGSILFITAASFINAHLARKWDNLKKELKAAEERAREARKEAPTVRIHEKVRHMRDGSMTTERTTTVSRRRVDEDGTTVHHTQVVTQEEVDAALRVEDKGQEILDALTLVTRPPKSVVLIEHSPDEDDD